MTGGTKEQKGDDVLVTFTDPETTGTLKFIAGKATAQVLVVGGGGGGGSVAVNTGGAAGGGGGGGVVQKSGLVFKNDYEITVGAGGEAATARSLKQGGSGGNSSIKTGDGDLVVDEAIGGGGGGAGGGSTSKYADGLPGGSGGGGSAKVKSGSTMTPGAGGSGTSNQGNDGGKGGHQYVGAGGGGAGAKAGDTSGTSKATAGGDGVLSDIRGIADDYFGGGGAGGDTRPTGGAIAGGLGGGGSGGPGDNKAERHGKDGFGGGGGGSGGYSAATYVPSGHGGSGIVIIRLSDYQAGGVPVPKLNPLTYTGTEQTIIEETQYYAISSGQNKATDAGDYTVTLKLKDPDDEWTDGQGGLTRTLPWKILQYPVPTPVPTKPSFVFDGTEQEGFTNGTGYAILENAKATAANTYVVKAKLTDANYKWADGTATAERSDLSWTIEKLLFDAPTPFAPSHTYDGTEQTGYVASVWYDYDGVNVATNGQTYSVTAKLKDEANTGWKPGVDPSLTWEIKPQTVTTITPKAGLVFTGEEQSAYDPTEEELRKFSLEGEKATDAGDYTLTATLLNPEGFTNYKWSDGKSTPLSLPWKIAPRVVPWPPEGAEHEYTYQKGVTNAPVPESPWYTIVAGIGSSETAGVFHCEVALNHNDGEKTNEKWSDDTTGHQEWDWEVKATVIDVPVVENKVYAENPKDTAVVHTALVITDSDPYVQTDDPEDPLTKLQQSQAGEYHFTLALKDPLNTVWSTGSSGLFDGVWAIRKADNVITGLTVRDWQVGDTDARTPSVTDVTFGNKMRLDYFWGTDPTGSVWTAWGEKKPDLAAGTYYLKAEAAGTKNWNATNAVTRFCVWTNPADVFTDFVDFTFTGDLKDKTVEFTVSEAQIASGAVTGGIPGFEHARAGVLDAAGTASELRFVCTNAVKMADELLAYTFVSWNKGGVSTVRVKLPRVFPTGGSIRMYWHAAEGEAQSDNHPEDVGAAVTAATPAFSLVSREGVLQDYWTVAPTITKTEVTYDPNVEWPTEADVTSGALKTGAGVKRYCLTMPRGTTNETSLCTQPGTYELLFTRVSKAAEEPTEIYGGEARLRYVITLENTYDQLGGTTSGRILLGNNDTKEGYAIGGQGYWQTSPELSGTSTFWWHSTGNPEDTPPASFVNLGVGVNHKLFIVSGDETNLLWRLSNMRLGAFCLNNGSYYKNYNYLPYSTTSQSRNEEKPVTSTTEVSYLVMRNLVDAALYSPCYSNGIGTVYFDAVNGFIADKDAKIVVEVAMTTAKGETPTDEHCRLDEIEDPLYFLTHQENGEPTNCWVRVTPTVLVKRSGETAFSVDAAQPTDGTIHLQVTKGNVNDEYYRIIAPVNTTAPCRFRIRRAAVTAGTDADFDNLILLDNVIVSPKAMSVAGEPLGFDDETAGRRGKQALGWAAAHQTPFPTMDDTAVIGRCKIHYNVTPGIPYDKSRSFIASARFNYRWRYLDQRKDLVFKTLYLDHNMAEGVEGEVIETVGAMELAGKVGDLEWYYDFSLQAPSYKYVDYSGETIEKPVGDYSEEIKTVVSSRPSEVVLASGGTNWFVRLREGASEWESLVLKTDTREEIPMELIADHIWRGYYKTVDGEPGGFRYRIEPRNRQDAGDVRYAFNTNYWYAGEDAATVPVSAILKTDGTTNSWARVPCDGYTGYLMFQVDDVTKSVSIVHADYMDFDNWDDAKNDDVFTGNSEEAGKRSGVSPRKREFDERFIWRGEPWTDTPSVNTNWTETFDGAASIGELYKPFGEATSLAGWKSGPGMYVYQWYRHDQAIPSGSGVIRRSLQMEGCGKGWLQFPANPDPQPRGLGTFSFKARLGQFIDLDRDIAYAEFPSDDLALTKDYTFMALAAFDTNSDKDFSGDASLSLFAYYRPRRGAYEFRLEQVEAKVSGSAVTGPAQKRRLTLYRWKADASGKMTAVALGSLNPDFTRVLTDGEKGRYMPMYMSVKNEADATVIKFGVYRNAASGNESPARGVPYDENISTICNRRYYSCVYRDTKAERLTGGTYGVLSANCDGVFLRPYVGAGNVATTKTDKDRLVEDGAENAQTFPSLKSCDADLEDKAFEEPWNISFGRMEVFPVAISGTKNVWGICAAPVAQDVALEVQKRGAINEWKTATTFHINSFGEAGSSGNPFSWRFDRTEDLDVRLRVLGAADDPRTDVIVDDLSLTQWRGCDYGDHDTLPFLAPGDGYGWRTNFVFSSGWVQDGTVLLSARRTAGWETDDKACAIRTPLFDGAGTPQRGIGLGLIAFSYKDAQPTARLQVQIATNNVTSSALGYDTIDPLKWTTVSNIDFSAMSPAQRASGKIDIYLGIHGVKGIARVCVDPEAVKAAHADGGDYTKEPDASKYGEVKITQMYCRDEPEIDLSAWWGWNLQTTDRADRQYLVDNLRFGDAANGLSLGLNNSTTKNVEDDPQTYIQEMPFVQSPTFVSNEVGEVTFRARKYELDQTQNAEIALYGARYDPVTKDLVWHCAPTDRPLARFVVSNDTFTTYTYKTKPGDGYQAFRLGVTGIKTVIDIHRGPDPTEGPNPVRVLVDEVLVSEAIRPKVGFRYCLPIRSALSNTAEVPGARTRDEQPILGDAWTVQAEIAVKLLPDEVDLKPPHEPRVFFHWYQGERNWGFRYLDPSTGRHAGWGTLSEAAGHRSAELKPVDGADLPAGTNMVFRGSYLAAPGAVVMAESPNLAATYRIYQYAAEVVYWDKKGNCITGVLDRTEWTRPEWYAPLDLNGRNAAAGSGAFSAYNVLEHVAPGRAWINEANVFDGRDESYEYPGDRNQYVEIAVPLGQSIENWSLYMIDRSSNTNLLCVFGQDGVAASKSTYTVNNYAFLTVQSPYTKKMKTLDAAAGEVDGTWQAFDPGDDKGELDQTHPIGLRLVRPSGILAQEIVLEGTNTWAGTGYEDRYSAETRVTTLNEADPERQWYLAGSEWRTRRDITRTSLGVTNVAVQATRTSEIAPTSLWTPDGRHTPGRCNEGEEIPFGWAVYPSGDMVLINATVSGPHIRQTVGEIRSSTASTIVATKKDGDGTNIVYDVDQWYEVGEVRENGVLKAQGLPSGAAYPAGRAATESMITVTATARPRGDLREKYGLDDKNRYTAAVMDWLEGGATAKGDFAYPGNIDLPAYRDLAGNFVTNLTLTEAYWFDIDPTGSNWCFRAGTCEAPHEVVAHFSEGPGGNPVYDPTGTADFLIKTNVRMAVYMVITNESTVGEQAGRAWSPYMLRGMEPGSDSRKYAAGETNAWDSVNFKMTGDPINGKPLREKWVPLRYFVFAEGSFAEDHTSVVEIPHPLSPDSLGINYGWDKYIDQKPPVMFGYKWSIDPRVAPVAIEVLRPTNIITW